MSSTAWRIIGAIVCVAGFQLLKYGIGETAGHVFVGITVVAATDMYFVYQHRLARLCDDVVEMSEDERNHLLQDVDPEIAEELRRKENDKNKG